MSSKCLRAGKGKIVIELIKEYGDDENYSGFKDVTTNAGIIVGKTFDTAVKRVPANKGIIVDLDKESFSGDIGDLVYFTNVVEDIEFRGKVYNVTVPTEVLAHVPKKYIIEEDLK